jgi:hypothetical protein
LMLQEMLFIHVRPVIRFIRMISHVQVICVINKKKRQI